MQVGSLTCFLFGCLTCYWPFKAWMIHFMLKKGWLVTYLGQILSYPNEPGGIFNMTKPLLVWAMSNKRTRDTFQMKPPLKSGSYKNRGRGGESFLLPEKSGYIDICSNRIFPSQDSNLVLVFLLSMISLAVCQFYPSVSKSCCYEIQVILNIQSLHFLVINFQSPKQKITLPTVLFK